MPVATFYETEHINATVIYISLSVTAMWTVGVAFRSWCFGTIAIIALGHFRDLGAKAVSVKNLSTFSNSEQ